jgi:hypothetical protein
MYILTEILDYDWQKTDPDLSSERAREQDRTVTVKQLTNIWSWAPDGARHQDILTDRPLVVDSDFIVTAVKTWSLTLCFPFISNSGRCTKFRKPGIQVQIVCHQMTCGPVLGERYRTSRAYLCVSNLEDTTMTTWIVIEKSDCLTQESCIAFGRFPERVTSMKRYLPLCTTKSMTRPWIS